MWSPVKPLLANSRGIRQAGFSLLEALITVVVLGTGLLGVAALQVNALKSNQSSFQRTQAVTMIYFMLDAMRANRTEAASGQYNISKTCTVPAASSSLASNDLNFWLDKIKKNIGDESTTCGEINCSSGGTLCTVSIYWNDERGIGGSSGEKLEVSTRL